MSDVPVSGRERVLDAAYDLFCRSGVTAVGVDAVIARAGTAKATLYRNFGSKDELTLAFLQRREERWTYGWLIAEVMSRADDPRDRLLAVFDVLDEWFATPDFEGCAFINVMLESGVANTAVRRASVRHLATIRGFFERLAADAGIEDADAFGRQWHILMKGAIVSAGEGDAQAARRAQELGELLLARHAV